jgi:D-amino-acid dehydrogenase
VSPRSVVICGGGVIGLSAAYFLLERGHRVTVLERGAAGHDCCSLGNAGYISPSHILPLAAPGMVGMALRWMGDPESPFYVRPRLDPEFLSWGFRFWRASSEARASRAAPLLRDLHLASRALFEELAEKTGNEFGLTREGVLMLFRSARALEEEAALAGRARGLGLEANVLDAKEAAALEPGVTLDVIGGVYYPLDAHVTPQRFHATLTRLVAERGGDLLWAAEVTGWRTERRAVRAVVTARGEIGADEFVVAAGAWSSLLLRDLGVRLPLQPGKGYSMTLDSPRERPRRSILLQEKRVAITPMGPALRFGGTMELGAFDLGISPPRIRGIVKSVTRYLPAFRAEDFAEAAPWSGLRPCSPDGLPYIGRFAGFDNLSAATGHAMMGLSMGPITGKLIAELLSGERPSIELAPLSPDRFRQRRVI